MFLIRVAAVSLLSLLSSMVWAGQPLPHLSAGFYVRTDGVAHLCRPFLLEEKATKQKRLNLAYIYSFDTFDNERRTPSDTEAGCEFIETSTRVDESDKTILKRVNVEECDSKVKSQITWTLTIRPDRLHLDSDDKFGPGYFCDWVKDDSARENDQ